MTDHPYRRTRATRKPQNKAPWVVRLFVWTALVLIFLAVGFYGSGLLFRMLDKKGMLPIDGVISNAKDLPSVMNVSDRDNITVGKNIDLKIYTLFQGSMGQGQLRIIGDYQEANIAKALAAVFASSDDKAVKDLRPSHLFRDGVTLYVDMPGAFVNALADLDAKAAWSLREALCRTVVENFPPINRVRFLTDDRYATDVNELDLSKTWEAPAQ